MRCGQSCWAQGHKELQPQLLPHSPSGHRGRWGHLGDTGRNLKRENRVKAFRRSNPAHEPPVTGSSSRASSCRTGCLSWAWQPRPHSGKAAHNSHSLWSKAHGFTHPRRCARDRTSARSPCCSTAMPSLRRIRGDLHSFHRNHIGLTPLPGIPALLPHRPQPRPEVALPVFGGSCGRRLVTGDRAKDGQGS